MLVNCPRCGFTQPQDKYCARCGVDMESYRAPQPSLISRTLGNPVLQISFVLLIAAIVGFSLYQKKHNEMQERVHYLQGVQVSKSVSVAGAIAGDELPTEFLEGSEVKTAAASIAPPATKAPPSVTEEKKLAAEKPAALGPVRLHLILAEVSEAALAQIYEISRGTGQFNSFGDYVAGILPDALRRLSAESRDIRILAREERPIDAQHPFQLFQGLHGGEDDNEIGLSYYIEMTEGEKGNLRSNLEVVRSWREPAGPNLPPTPAKTNYPAAFELAPGNGFFMAGLLRPGAPPELETALASVAPFQILRSPEFKARASEFVLFLQMDRADASPATGAPGAPVTPPKTTK